VVGVLQGFAVVVFVIGVGVIAGRTGGLGANVESALSRVVLLIALPALLFCTLSNARLTDVFSAGLVVLSIVTMAMFAACLVAAMVIWHRAGRHAVVAAWSASYSNAGYLGIPIATYAFGDATLASSVVLFQLAIMLPMGIAMLDAFSSRGKSITGVLTGVVRTPTVVASLGGIAVAACGLRIPAVVMEPITMLSDVAVPAALLAFGMSLAGAARLPQRGSRGEVTAICALKLVAMPLLTYLVGRYVADLPAAELMPVTVLAALPTAQNVYAAASAYQASESLARETGLITTVVSLPTVGILVSALELS
jgi:predicted permease